jgi:hypothetical protein
MECRSMLHPSEKELLEWHSITKNIPACEYQKLF